MKINKYIIILLLIVGAGAVSWTTYLKEFNEEDTVSIHSFPQEINGWVSEELPITEDEYAILETRNVFTRKYTGPKGQIVYFFTVYSQYNRKVAHPPEVCYTGSGIKVVSNTVDAIPIPEHNVTIKAHKLRLERRHLKQVAYYWFKVGDTFTPSYWQQQLRIAIKNLLGRPEGSALIRVSAVYNGDDQQAVEDIKEFTRLVLPAIYKHLP
ncbi:MAG: EpsI family protein [Candidatus Omnitrophica bacterium]|nr:EpsI family protein [Candidatus Omnitrophota bacterium]